MWCLSNLLTFSSSIINFDLNQQSEVFSFHNNLAEHERNCYFCRLRSKVYIFNILRCLVTCLLCSGWMIPKAKITKDDYQFLGTPVSVKSSGIFPLDGSVLVFWSKLKTFEKKSVMYSPDEPLVAMCWSFPAAKHFLRRFLYSILATLLANQLHAVWSTEVAVRAEIRIFCPYFYVEFKNCVVVINPEQIVFENFCGRQSCYKNDGLLIFSLVNGMKKLFEKLNEVQCRFHFVEWLYTLLECRFNVSTWTKRGQFSIPCSLERATKITQHFKRVQQKPSPAKNR